MTTLRAPSTIWLSRAALTAALFATPALLGGCPEQKADTRPKACCEQPEIPAGVKPVTVVADDISGPSDGQKVIMRAAIKDSSRRDELYPVLHTLYRHAMKRSTFEPIHFVADLYGSEEDAHAGGEAKALARITRGQGDRVPRCDIKVRYSFAEQVARAFASSMGRAVEEDLNDTCHLDFKKPAPRPDDEFKLRPTFKVIAERRAVAISLPYTQLGKDEYAQTLSYNSALTYWIEFVTSMFRKVDDLKEVTFAGVWNDAPVVNITVTREEFNSGLASLQEEIAAHGGVTFQSLGIGKMNDQQAHKEQEAFKTKTYKLAIDHLPKSQVSISPKLK